MPNRIKCCSACSRYTLKDKCGCGGKAIVKTPPKYSPLDKMAKYRRQEKKKILKEKGLL